MKRAEEILAWWFDGASDDTAIGSHSACYRRWFRGGAAMDEQVRALFAADVEAARAGACEGWKGQPRGELALLLLLDQFPRHIYRGRAAAFASDAAAYQTARACIAARRDEQLALVERVFAYLPLQHSERIEDHDLAFERFRALIATAKMRGAAVLGFCEGSIHEQQEHTDTLRAFGRYPYRNAALGRASTPAELDFLERRR